MQSTSHGLLRLVSGREPVRNPSLRFVDISERGRPRIINTPKTSLQAPSAGLILVLVREAHQYRYEEAIVEHEMAFGVLAASRNLYGLEVEGHAAARFPRCR
jgi:hypothetical protein